MKTIGITGGIGSGKSLVAKILINSGFIVYDSDIRADYLMHHDEKLIQAIKIHFGDESYLNNQSLNRRFLSTLVFSDPKNLKTLNKLVHPQVEKDFSFFKLNHYNKSLLFKEAAILYESGAYKKCDAILVVTTSDDEIRIKRTMQRDQISRDEVLKRINNQWKESRKIDLADFIIYNNGTIKDLNNKIQETLKVITDRYFID